MGRAKESLTPRPAPLFLLRPRSIIALVAAGSVLIGRPLPPSALASSSPLTPPPPSRASSSPALDAATEIRGGAGRLPRPPSSLNAVVEPEAVESDLCRNVRHVLNGRLEAVRSGARGRDFARRYKKENDAIDGAYTVTSGIGGKSEDGNGSGSGGEKKAGGQMVVRKDGDASPAELLRSSVLPGSDLFPDDLSSLELTLLPSAWAATAASFLELREREEKLVNHDDPPSAAALCVRACKLGFMFGPAVWTAWLAAILPPFRRKVWFGMVGRSLARSGPAFIKWGQWASTRADMFPDALCEALSQLHSDAPAHAWSHTEKSVEQSLCIPPGSLGDVFASFEMDPVASGSIAQVHRAILRTDDGDDNIMGRGDGDSDDDEEEGGTLVAIKVRHPRVSRLIDMDFRLMSIAADVVDHLPFMGWLRLRSSVEQFSHTMAAQAHLNVEAHHLEVLNHNFRNWKSVGFPMPFFSSAAVIMETFESGKVCTEVMDNYDRIAADTPEVTFPLEEEEVTVEEGVDGKNGGKRKKRKRGKKAPPETYPGHRVMPVPMAKFIVGTGVSIYLKMLLVDNLMHADLHPGNLMLSVDEMQYDGEEEEDNDGEQEDDDDSVATPKKSSRRYRGHIALVDAGMVAQLDESESVNFIGLLSSLGEGNGRTAAEAVLRFSADNDGAVDLDDCGCGDVPPEAKSGGLTAEQREAFTQDMIALFDEKCGGYGTGVDVGAVLTGVLGLIRDHRVRIEANYATLVVNALCIESLANRVCPSYNVLDGAKPLLQSFRKICQSKDGKVALCHRSKFRKAVLKMGVPILYLKKNLYDDNFFRRLEIAKRLGRQPAIVSSLFSGVVGVAALVLSAKVAQDSGLITLPDLSGLGSGGGGKVKKAVVVKQVAVKKETVPKAPAKDVVVVGAAARDSKSFLFGVFERWLRLDYQY